MTVQLIYCNDFNMGVDITDTELTLKRDLLDLQLLQLVGGLLMPFGEHVPCDVKGHVEYLRKWRIMYEPTRFIENTENGGKVASNRSSARWSRD